MTTQPIPSTTDDLIAEIEAEIKHAKESCFEQWLERVAPSGDASDVTAQWEASSELADLLERYRYVIAPVERVRELEQYKREAMQVMSPVLDYARPLNLAKLGESITQALISDHQRLVELEQAQRWVPVEEKFPEPGIVVLGWWVNQGPMMAVWDGLHWGDADDHIAIGYGISHWKPVTPP
ncbi:hypothetical protein [Pseudomonas abyssi]|uniref:hypothetical protein n=1 Tax=Pseudomonas abyssi TaxID=170540 RepID=UPI003C7BDE51